MRAPTRRLRFLVGGCVLRREDCVFSSEDACSDEKIAFSRRRGRAPTRRMRFLVGEGALQREDGMFSSTNACVGEKITFSRRWLRPPTKRLHFLVVRWIRSKSWNRIHDRPLRHPILRSLPAFSRRTLAWSRALFIKRLSLS